jgi:tripartite-type tricarboxylate transporter receptor subunit TctC
LVGPGRYLSQLKTQLEFAELIAPEEASQARDQMGLVKRWHAAVVAIAFIVAANVALAGEWPKHPILVVSPFATVTTSDTIAQTVLGPAGAQLGQPFVLENRPGRGGTAAVASVAKVTPDGYTLLLATSAMTAAVIMHKSLPYDIVSDLAPVAMFAVEPGMLMAAPGKGYNSVADLVAAAKATPGAIKFGSVGLGSASYIAGERFRQLAGLNVVHVAYTGAAEALADLTAGRIDFYFVPVTPALPLIVQGKGTALAVSTPDRLRSLPGLPTLKESGYVIPYLNWCGLSVPAKTSPDIIAKMNRVIADVLELPAVRTKLLRTGYVPAPMSAQQYGEFVANDVAAMTDLGKQAHIEPLD